MLSDLQAAVAAARKHGHLYFAAFLSEQRILSALGEASSLWQGWIYTPAVTVWVFLSQCLSQDHSCREAVSKLIAWRVSQGLPACSAETNAYCTARGYLPEDACRKLVQTTGRETEDAAPAHWHWHGRRVRVVDGTTLTMPDTPANQAEYPQVAGQKPGCGFPIVRLLTVFSLTVGTALEAAIGPYSGKETGENSLFRLLYKFLAIGDVVLADRYFSGWFDIGLLLAAEVDVVLRKHQLRATDFRTGRRLGTDDHLVVWTKPARPAWMSAKQYAALPDELVLREVRVRVTQKGFRTKEVLVITSLLDASEYSLEELATLYRRRWQAELHLRSLKIILQMDHLRCKTPQRVRNEIWVHLLGYNLIRGVMAQAAACTRCEPWEVSFTGALQAVGSFLPLLIHSKSIEVWLHAFLQAVGTHRVGHRPDRYEPRVKKRRPKSYKLMREPRVNYRKRMAA